MPVRWFQIRIFLTMMIILLVPLEILAGNPVQISIFHTNDLHSRFRTEKGPLRLGGIARLKTKLDQLRKDQPLSVLVDGGDWSEGTIYYTEGAGTSAIQMMDALGYDAAVIGNH